MSLFLPPQDRFRVHATHSLLLNNIRLRYSTDDTGTILPHERYINYSACFKKHYTHWTSMNMEAPNNNPGNINESRTYMGEACSEASSNETFMTAWDHEAEICDDRMSLRSFKTTIEDISEDPSSLIVTRASLYHKLKSIGSDEDRKLPLVGSESFDEHLDATNEKEEFGEKIFVKDGEQSCYVLKCEFYKWTQEQPATKYDVDKDPYATPVMCYKSLNGEETFDMEERKRKYPRVVQEYKPVEFDYSLVRKTASFHVDFQAPGDFRDVGCEWIKQIKELSTAKKWGSKAEMKTEFRIEARINLKPNSILSSRLCLMPTPRPESSPSSKPELETLEPTSQSDSESLANASPEKKFESKAEPKADSKSGAKSESASDSEVDSKKTKLASDSEVDTKSDLETSSKSQCDESESECNSGAHSMLDREHLRRLVREMNSRRTEKDGRRKRTLVKKLIGGVYKQVMSCFRVVRTTHN